MNKRAAFPLGIECKLLSEQNDSNLLTSKIQNSHVQKYRSTPY